MKFYNEVNWHVYSAKNETARKGENTVLSCSPGCIQLWTRYALRIYKCWYLKLHWRTAKTNGNSIDLVKNVGEPFGVVLNMCCEQSIDCFMKHFSYCSEKINSSEKPSFNLLQIPSWKRTYCFINFKDTLMSFKINSIAPMSHMQVKTYVWFLKKKSTHFSCFNIQPEHMREQVTLENNCQPSSCWDVK